jgi:hypothetical protein
MNTTRRLDRNYVNSWEEKMERCVRCLSDELTRKRAGFGKVFCILQCLGCGFNVTADNFEDAEAAWNGFKVWELVEALKLDETPTYAPIRKAKGQTSSFFQIKKSNGEIIDLDSGVE